MTKKAESDLVLVAKPRKLAMICWVGAALVFAVCALAATGMGGMTEGGGVFHSADAYAMVGMGALAAAGILVFARPRVWAGPSGIKIRNLVNTVELPWEMVDSVMFLRTSSWAALRIADDDIVAVMAIQANDGPRAVEAVRRLRELLAEANSEYPSAILNGRPSHP